MRKKDEFNPVQNSKTLMRINRILSNNKVIAALIIILDIVLLCCFNYVVNVFSKITLIIGDLSNSSQYVGFENVLPSIELITGSSFVRTLYIIIIITLFVLDLITVYRIKIAYSDQEINRGQKGSNRWTTKEEIKAQYKEIEQRVIPYKGDPGTLISEFDGKTYIDTAYSNNYYIGITRSFKGECFVTRNIEIYTRAEIKPSVILFDPKAELYKTSKPELIKRGYDCYLMNLENPLLSMGFNPMSLAVETAKKGDMTHAEDLIHSLAYSLFDPDSATGNEKYFREAACNLFEGMLIAMTNDAIKEDNNINKKRKSNYKKKTELFKYLSPLKQQEVREQFKTHTTDECLDYDIPYIPDDIPYKDVFEYEKCISIYSCLMLIMNLNEQKIIDYDENGQPYDTGQTYLDLYFLNRPENDRAKFKYFSVFSAKSHKTIGNVMSTMLTRLNIFSYESVAKMSAESSFNLQDIGFGDKPIAIFIGAPDYDKSRHILASIFIKQVYFANAEGCWDKGACKRPIKVIGDEIGNFPAVDGMDSIITVCAGRHITFDLYLQSDQQLEEVYKDAAKTIKDNCANKFFILSDNEDTVESFSKMIGNETSTDVQRSGNKFSLNKHFMESTMEKPLISASNLQNLHEGECVIKRISKRRDNRGNDIKPHPIFNSVEKGMRITPRYKLLEDIFPSPTGISLASVNTESRKHIDLKKYLWNPEITFRQFAEEKKCSNNSELKFIKDFSPDINTSVHNLMKKVMGYSYEETKVNEMDYVTAMDMIFNDTSIKDHEKNSIKTVIDIALDK